MCKEISTLVKTKFQPSYKIKPLHIMLPKKRAYVKVMMV